MKKIIICLIAIIMIGNVCEAKRRKYYPTSSYTSIKYTVDNSTAQGVANTMSQRNCVSHFGGHGGMYEGCGSGWTQNEAYNNCCYSNSGMRVVDVGYAQSKYGMWYCCKRYSRY